MTKTTEADTSVALLRLEAVLDRLERLGLTAPEVTPASVNPNGTPGPVAAGELIESAWGNAVADSISTLWGHPVAVRAATGPVTTDASGIFTINTGFAPVAVSCTSASVTAHSFVLFEMSETRVQIQAFNAAGVAIVSGTIAVSYVIFAAAGGPGT
jgi:hypothetical protein